MFLISNTQKTHSNNKTQNNKGNIDWYYPNLPGLTLLIPRREAE